MTATVEALERSLRVRASLLSELGPETDCVRLLHGVAEGAPGVTVDRYGPVLLVQTWRAPLEEGELASLHRTAADVLGAELSPVWNHRGEGSGGSDVDPSLLDPEAPPIGHELGIAYDVRPRHRGQDPHLFLDLRVARRWMRSHAAGKRVLNLYAYTCGIGVVAAHAGATSVHNVDFAASALRIGEANAVRNGIAVGPAFTTAEGDAQVVARGFAGLSTAGRRKRGVAPPRPVAKQTFDLVVLDPPRWSKSAFGAVDVIRDYPSLFKPAVLCCAPGGVVIATNHVPSVDREGWLAVLRRTAEKAERPLTDIEVLTPDSDFPSFDGQPPLKVAVCRVG